MRDTDIVCGGLRSVSPFAMIINADTNHLLKRAPTISQDWISTCETWLKIVLNREYQPVFEAQLEMVTAVLGIEEEVVQLDEARKFQY